MEYKQANSLFKELKCCVAIPTYNNATILPRILNQVLLYSQDVIVVNDGSTDNTDSILKSYNILKIISYNRNRGKGYALKKAFEFAREHGFDYVITMDSDGQHQATDLPLFLEKIRQNPQAIIIGSRNMHEENMPRKNSFGNRFSNFWFRFETGIKLPDTQCGFRVYPLKPLERKKFFCNRYEFELEVIVRLAWSNTDVVPLPIRVIYPPASERISHFKPWKDFTRISLLNILFVLIAILIIKPFKFINSLNKKNVREFFKKYIVQNQDSDSKITFSVMLGLFMGIAPFWGYQMGLALVIAMFFKLNKVITLVASNISIPPMIPLILYLSYLCGGLVHIVDPVNVPYSKNLTLYDVQINLFQYLIGSFMLAGAVSLVFGIATFVLLKIFRKQNKTVKLNEQEKIVSANE